MTLTGTQRATLHDLFSVIARTDAATADQRERATHLAKLLAFDAMLDGMISGGGPFGASAV